MIDFEYHAPTSLDEVFGLLDQYGDDARVMAGGTALVIQMKQRLSQPSHVVGLRRVGGLNSIEKTPEGVRIGALCTQRQVENSPLIGEEFPLLADTFRKVATPRIRNMATIGGGLVNGDPNQDPPPSLIALGASAVMTSKKGDRVVALEDLFIDYYETDVQPGEVLTSVLVPRAPSGSGSVYLKFLPRTADDYGTVSVAAVVSREQNGDCKDIRIVLGSVGVTPIRAKQAEDALRGKPLTDENIRAAAALVKDAVDPLEDFRGSAEYKTDMAEVFARRAVEQAMAAIPAGS
ncbi:MAG: xanthine dehydrogenase family protein subunit M [Chloroflexi bacterium]|nr:xanthine dehydrogenase family protein subunit M [Chloroflexota bacterium]MCH8891891.1 xanthine dehydrogenase family protein subunit M [Chloroflexota bacterium]MCI0862868.1 xanthine dehydrogenase family protein subunit M [Chloroflexota bacterium]MCI0899337.1 xanthine dehydrogenase family protein subunit M [Chloroflexota bacterium]MCI0904056.1 xanthine dehydrogenase family protein subunit M [Chloroflexota bacterium]